MQYSTRINLLSQSEKNKEVSIARQAALKQPEIKAIISELNGWPGKPLLRHNDASHLLHKLVFMADIGIKVDDPGIKPVIDKILQNRSSDGFFQVIANISPHYGGSGKDEPGWMLCDTPSILYALVKMEINNESAIQTAAKRIADLSFNEGWPCVVSPNMGKFRGPGRMSDPCPYATLLCLKALTQLPGWRDNAVCKKGAETLLRLWEQRKERRPYLFAMGTDFAKLKQPFIWYDILHVLEVLTQLPYLRRDKRVLEMKEIVKRKADTAGRFLPESVFKAWTDWDFGQKKVPSYWVTLQAQKVLQRLD